MKIEKNSDGSYDLTCPYCNNVDSCEFVKDKIAWKCIWCEQSFEIDSSGNVTPFKLTKKEHKVRFTSGRCKIRSSPPSLPGEI